MSLVAQRRRRLEAQPRTRSHKCVHPLRATGAPPTNRAVGAPYVLCRRRASSLRTRRPALQDDTFTIHNVTPRN
eukprot:scaffold4147_cov412-Prasinococcus_capsulatus_cf.AAC.6